MANHETPVRHSYNQELLGGPNSFGGADGGCCWREGLTLAVIPSAYKLADFGTAITTSMRRFWERPSSFSLLAIGALSP